MSGSTALRHEMMRKERESSSFASSSIDAAALQLELARKMGLPVSSAGKSSLAGSSKKTKVVALTDSNNRHFTPKPSYKTCPSCRFQKVEISSKLCTDCGFFFLGNVSGGGSSSSTGGGGSQGLSLAQKRGLVEIPVELKPLTKEEWSEVEATAVSRKECHCPICMVGFNQGCEVLLSCSHMFHRSCIASFERFVKVPNDKRHQLKSFSYVCPLCRTTNYQKRMTNKGSIAYRRSCAVIIQAVIRGHLARHFFRQKMRRYYNEGNGCVRNRVKFAHKEMMAVGSSITKTIESQDRALDSLMDSSDAVLMENQNLDLLFDQMLRNRYENNKNENGDNSDTIESDTNEYYSKFHSVNVEPVVPLKRENLLQSTMIGPLSVREWDNLLITALTRRVGDKIIAPCLSNETASDSKLNSDRSDDIDDDDDDEEDDECAICMGPIPKALIFPCGSAAACGSSNTGKKAISTAMNTITLLNCSHMFHDSCITNFEKFTPHNAKSCPVCRNTKDYHRRLLSKCCVGFQHPKNCLCHIHLNKQFASSIEEVRSAEKAGTISAVTAGKGTKIKRMGGDDEEFDLAVQQSLEYHQAELEREYQEQLVDLLGRDSGSDSGRREGQHPRSTGDYSNSSGGMDSTSFDHGDSAADSKDEQSYSYSVMPSFKFSSFDSDRKVTSSSSSTVASLVVRDRNARSNVDMGSDRLIRDKKQSGSGSGNGNGSVRGNSTVSSARTGKGTGKSSAFGDLLNRYK